MPQQKNLIIGLVLVIVVLVGVIIYQSGSRSSGGDMASSTASTTQADVVGDSAAATTTSEVKPVATTAKPATTAAPKNTSGGSYVTLSYSSVRDAVFNLHVQVNDTDIRNGEHMEYCVLTTAQVKAGAPCDGDQMVYGQGFKIEYTEAANVLRISDVSGLKDRKPNLAEGAFRPNCTGCSVYVEFSGIHDERGNVLPTKRVWIHSQ